MSKPKVLILDIETSPLLSYCWGLFDQTIPLNQIHQDWFVLSWSAKWLGDPPSKTMYMDQRDAKNIENDKKILKALWKLIDEADIVISQNGRRFDIPKLNARFISHGFQPPSSFKHIDILQVTRRKFGFTSHKLEYMTNKLCVKYKKQKHRKYPGFELWKECLSGNLEAWQSMENYNKYDVLSLEELYNIVIPWDNSINFNLYTDEETNTCKCGSTKFNSKGYHYTATGKFKRYKCVKCGAEQRSRKNLFTKEKRQSLRVGS